MTVLTNTTPSSRRSAALGGKRRSVLAGFGIGVAALALIVAGVAAAQSPAQAAPTTAPGSASSNVASPSPSAPVAPTIQVADSDTGSTTARGTGTPGASLRILDPVHPASSLCTTTVAADGTWSCTVSVSSGAGQQLTVRDLTDTTLSDVTSPTFSVLTAPVLSTSSGIAVGASVSGTGYAGATVVVSLTNSANGARASVDATVSASGTWQAVLSAATVPTGSYVATAVQSSSAIPNVPTSSTSGAISITIDRQAPPPPRLTQPAANSTVTKQPLVFDGTGENGDTVTTYVDSNPVCTAIVHGGHWSCRSTGLLIPAGARTVQAAQRDVAGNYGPPTAGTRVTFAAATPTATPSASPSPQASGQPSQPQPEPSPSSSTPAAPGASGGSGGSSGSGSAGGTGSGSGSGTSAGSPAGGTDLGATSSLAAASSWTGSTGFGQALPTLTQGFDGSTWVWALGLGLAFVLLVLAPLRLAATALGGRLAVRVHRLTGRNRPRALGGDSPALSPVAATAIALAVGALLVALAAGVDDQVRYVRLVVAIVIGLGLVNGLGVVLPSLMAGRRLGLRLRLRVSAPLLIVAALACLATRLFDVDPPVVLGVLLTAALVDASGRDLDETGDVQRGGILATVQLGSLALVSFVAWILHGLLPAGTTVFAVEISRETLTTVCLTGLGSLILLLLPVGNLPGRAIFAWSKPTLVGLGVVGVAMAAVVYAGNPDEGFPVLPLIVAAIAFAVIALSTWVWVRYVEPATE